MKTDLEYLIAEAEALMNCGEIDLEKIDAIIGAFEKYDWHKILFDQKKRIRGFADWAYETINPLER